MKYPKAMMKIQEFAQKIDPRQKNSPIVFDTEGFDKWRMKMLRVENKAIIRG